jgi:hypothetical protein
MMILNLISRDQFSTLRMENKMS